jgi:hypothetical protein
MCSREACAAAPGDETSVLRPLVRLAEQLAQWAEDPAVRLWALCRSHVRLLLTTPRLHALSLGPWRRAEQAEDFEAQRQVLKTAYRSLVVATHNGQGTAADDIAPRMDVIFGLVEGLVLFPGECNGLDVEEMSAHVADAALQLAGYPTVLLPRLRAAACALLATFGSPSHGTG